MDRHIAIIILATSFILICILAYTIGTLRVENDALKGEIVYYERIQSSLDKIIEKKCGDVYEPFPIR